MTKISACHNYGHPAMTFFINSHSPQPALIFFSPFSHKTFSSFFVNPLAIYSTHSTCFFIEIFDRYNLSNNLADIKSSHINQIHSLNVNMSLIKCENYFRCKFHSRSNRSHRKTIVSLPHAPVKTSIFHFDLLVS